MVKNISCKNDWLKLIADKTTDFTFFGKRSLNGDYHCCIGTQNTKTVKHQSTAIGTAICTKTHSKKMVKRSKAGSSGKRETDKANYHQEKVDTVNAILASMENDTQTFWKPTYEEMKQIGLVDDDDDSPAVSEETLDELEEQLSRIYHVVPHAICYAHSNAFANSNPVLAQKVREVFGDRYETLRMQHGVAYRLLRLKYPVLYRVAEHNKFLKSLEWNQMRTRLTQAEQNTDDKTWLDRMYELLNNKVIKELKGRYRKNEDGDLEVSNIFYDVGKRFAVGIDTACSVLLPDHIFIAGEVGRQKDYVKGIFSGLKEINSAFTSEEISICDTRSSQASGVFALNEFLFSDDLNLYDREILDKRAS